ncbi:MAG: phenylalanine--tRNA ligase subunit alpha [Kiritimatiellae bacterium]|nr:phenylalanine--tRNA ligase subunit alpha [Kiritimatiellia bacterium]
MTLQEIDAAKEAALAEIAAAKDEAGVEAARVKFLGRNGSLPAMMKGLRDVAPADKPAFGQALNALRAAVSAALEERKAAVAAQSGPRDSFDFSLPGNWRGTGAIHPVSEVIEETTRIFARLGFTVADGPDIETEFNNFDALNTAKHHPSRDERDTFWLGPELLLRTQTSPVQIRAMLAKKPPVRIINPGRCYRRDTTDATHAANFHQIEGLYVDVVPVSLADLKSTLAHFAREMMGPSVQVRFRPHFFPFTEPSVEVDFSCHVCKGKGCAVCKQSGWIEVMGAGIVDTRVFGKVGYDPDCYGYAFGMGVERIAMIKHGVTDLRTLYANDLRYLREFL